MNDVLNVKPTTTGIFNLTMFYSLSNYPKIISSKLNLTINVDSKLHPPKFL